MTDLNTLRASLDSGEHPFADTLAAEIVRGATGFRGTRRTEDNLAGGGGGAAATGAVAADATCSAVPFPSV